MPNRMAKNKIKKDVSTKHWQGCGKAESLTHCCEKVKFYSHYEKNNLVSSYKTKHAITK